jgi:hypothetical protein
VITCAQWIIACCALRAPYCVPIHLSYAMQDFFGVAATGSWQAIVRGAGHTQFLTAGEQIQLLTHLVQAFRQLDLHAAAVAATCMKHAASAWLSTAHCRSTGRLLDPALRLLCGGGSISTKQVVNSTLFEDAYLLHHFITTSLPAAQGD